jgi:hypothetical protein
MAEINTTQMRDALAWVTNDQQKAEEPSTNPFVWFWEAMQGDFNEERSTGQLVIDAAISMIPLVDQVCDVRDLIANCNKLRKDVKDTWAWVALALTLIGLFPTLGSLVKGVLKIFFGFVRRMGGDAMVKAVELAMTWVITFLRRRDVQKYLRLNKVDEVFKWLAVEIKGLRGKVNVGALLKAFDRGIKVLEHMANKVSYVPKIGAKAKACLEEVRDIRKVADQYLGKALKPVQDALDTIIMRLERESLERQHGILNANNIHYRGALPEASAVTLMRKAKPVPEWLNQGKPNTFHPLIPAKEMADVTHFAKKEKYPLLTEDNIASFHEMRRDMINGPARLYRVLAPNSRAMSDCWVTEEVFKQLQAAENPRAAWRKYLAVWPDWNVNGQFVVYDIKPGETLKVYRGLASSQVKKSLPNRYLEGGWEQVIFKLEKSDPRADSVLFFEVSGSRGHRLNNPISQDDYYKLPQDQRSKYTSLRQTINHPNISGPFDTGWGYADFGGAGLPTRVGLPALPGQSTNLAK